MKTICLFFLMFFVSCAGYVDKFHRQIDREEKVGVRPIEDKRDPFSQYRTSQRRKKVRPEEDRRPISNPITLGQGGQMRPPVKREYRPQRYQANDFVDNDNGGSLWANQGQSASLFTYQNDKHTGDMVIINVLENLRNQISAELKRTFPDPPKKEEAKSGAKTPATAAGAPAANAADSEMDMKVYDKISGTVTEEVSKDYIILRGRKEVIFKKEKRSIEVQALVSRKDIMENDYVNSDKLLESRVFVLGNNQ